MFGPEAVDTDACEMPAQFFQGCRIDGCVLYQFVGICRGFAIGMLVQQNQFLDLRQLEGDFHAPGLGDAHLRRNQPADEGVGKINKTVFGVAAGSIDAAHVFEFVERGECRFFFLCDTDEPGQCGG
jgi:hypothetical protein